MVLGEVGSDAVDFGGREPGQELGEQRLLGVVGRGPAEQGAADKAGQAAQDGQRVGATPRAATRNGRTLPPRVSVPSKSKAATVGRVPGATLMVPRSWSDLDIGPTATGPGGEPGGAGERLAGGDDVTAAASFEDGRVGLGEPPLLDGGGPVAAQAGLGEGGELVGEVDGGARASPGATSRLASPMARASGPSTARPVRMRSIAREWPIRRGRRTVPEVAERDPEPAAEDTEDGVVGGHPQVAPQGELEAAGDGVALDGGDHGLGQRQPGRAHGPGAVVGHGPSVTGARAFRSAPAQKCRPAPVRTATAAPSSPSNCTKASRRRSAVAASTALRTPGGRS